MGGFRDKTLLNQLNRQLARNVEEQDRTNAKLALLIQRGNNLLEAIKNEEAHQALADAGFVKKELPGQPHILGAGGGSGGTPMLIITGNTVTQERELEMVGEQ